MTKKPDFSDLEQAFDEAAEKIKDSAQADKGELTEKKQEPLQQISQADKQRLLLEAEQSLQLEMEKSSVAYRRSRFFLRWGAIVFILTVLLWLFNVFSR